jgi:hypothetical protein
MSGGRNVEEMFAGIEALREGVTSLLLEIDMLKAENESLKGHMIELQDQVSHAKHHIESVSRQMATAYEDRRSSEPMMRILPHDRAAEKAAIAEVVTERKKKGGL